MAHLAIEVGGGTESRLLQGVRHHCEADDVFGCKMPSESEAKNSDDFYFEGVLIVVCGTHEA